MYKQTNWSKMRTSSFAVVLFISLCLPSSSWVTADNSVYDNFLQCLYNYSQPSNSISGVIYTPSNSSYSTVSQSYIRNLRFNESTTSKPLLIITALEVSHIQIAIGCAKTHGLQMKIRSGGHDYEGVSYVSDVPFFVLDMFNLRSINVSIKDETAWVQTGATLVDNIIDALIIDVNGNLLDRASTGEDMFWAITGGGGSSFGVVLAYKINLVPVLAIVTVFRVERTLAQNATDIVHRWQEVADKLDNDIFIRMIIDVVNSGGNKTIRASFVSLFLGDTERLLSIMIAGFPELGLQKSDCHEMPWLESVLYWTGFPNGTSVDALLSRVPQVLTHLKRKSDYLKEPIPKEGLEYIFQRMMEFVTPILTFNPCGGRMAKISEFATPFPHRAGNLANIQYATNWKEDGVEAANHYINLTRMLYGYMTPFVSKFPTGLF
ncbi:hypothetical protein RJ639_027413 [Escallonia herrerae]|uniref:FAD-binding PCMH-type domain-containing protein n=1 Tax=Escallonia herrerae TaxID=1293975 RepID=A0AA88X4H3_9ASTE|nr:hypothetical protein RJ639_027413 [Escallonia herrerae]